MREHIPVEKEKKCKLKYDAYWAPPPSTSMGAAGPFASLSLRSLPPPDSNWSSTTNLLLLAFQLVLNLSRRSIVWGPAESLQGSGISKYCHLPCLTSCSGPGAGGVAGCPFDPGVVHLKRRRWPVACPASGPKPRLTIMPQCSVISDSPTKHRQLACCASWRALPS